MSSYKHFAFDLTDHIVHLRFNRPEKANSLVAETWEEMQKIFEDINDMDEARVVVFSGEGKHFCAGMDLQTLMDVSATYSSTCEARKREKIKSFIFKIQESITSIEKCKIPVLAAIHGGCIGGGVDISTACDIRYCSDDAYFTIKEIDLGLVADIGALQRLPTIVNPGIAAEMAYTGRRVYGPEAVKINLVNKSYIDKNEMMATVNGIAKTIAEKSPLCIRGTKEMLLYKRDHSVADSLYNMANFNAAMLLSNDLMQAFQAHVSKTKPTFEN